MQQKTQKKPTAPARKRRSKKPAMSRRRPPCTRPPQDVPEPNAATPPSQKLLEELAKHGALPPDLAARLTNHSEDLIEEMYKEGVKRAWLRSVDFAMEPKQWALLLGAGLKRAATDFGRRTPPSPLQITHRREVIEALLIFRKEKPGWRWIPEAAYHVPGAEGRIPDGKLAWRKKLWAIEIEREWKGMDEILPKLRILCEDYDRVVYFASAQIREALAPLQKDFANLELRPLPGGEPDPEFREAIWTDYTPSSRGRRLLEVVNKEGLVARSQLHRALGWTPSELDEVLAPLETHSCIRQGHEVNDDKGWVWCNYRGANRSGTGLKPLKKVPSRGALVRRFVLMEIRLDVLAKWPDAEWITRRMLEQGHTNRLKDAPRAIVEHDGLCYAVMVLESTPAGRKKTVARLERWKEEYDGVICYRAEKVAGWTEVLIQSYGMGWVKFRDMPKPPSSSPYKRLEDEWRSGKEFYRPTDKEQRLLDLAMRQGMLSEIQLHRALGSTPEEADRLVDSLIEHNCLISENGWLRCNGRGARLSNTKFARAKVTSEDSLSRRFELMEIQLHYGKPASTENWKTNRQITYGIKGNSGLPRAAVKIDGAWYVVAIYFKEFHTKKTLRNLRRWSKEKGYRGVKCFCLEEQLESFKQFIENHGLSAVEVEAFPVSPDEFARSCQEDYYASLRMTKEERRIRDRPKKNAHQAVASAVRTGRLKKPDRCEICNRKVPKARLQGHHEDYSKPLDVEWLCGSKCHPAKDKARRECEARTKGPARQNPRRSKASPGPVQKAQGQLSLT